MKKFKAIFIPVLIIIIFASCKDLKKNNPYDPAGNQYSGITYKGQTGYPDGTDIRAMLILSGQPVFAGYSQTSGFCVIKMTGDTTYDIVGSTGDIPGTFNDIKDMCADDFGNIYIVDKKNIVQTISPANVMNYWPITSTTGIDNLSIECLNNNIFITNLLDKTVNKYSLSGVLADSLTLSFTSYGNFVPGKIFKSYSHLYVVNAMDKSVIVKLTDTLINAGEFKFQDDIIDGVMAGQQMQLLGSQAVYKVDSDLGLTLKWGDFGVGAGRVLNGKLVAYDSGTDTVYTLDGLTIKKFGE
jgi:hypothetical protein